MTFADIFEYGIYLAIAIGALIGLFIVFRLLFAYAYRKVDQGQALPMRLSWSATKPGLIRASVFVAPLSQRVSLGGMEIFRSSVSC